MPRKTRSRTEPIRGLMVDPARLVEKHSFYFDLLPRLADWGFNTLWWHFVDDQGFVLKLDSRPELATPFAFTKAETRRLVEAAADVGITVVPEVETLGHARYITRLPRYAHLADGKTSGGFNACCPSHPDTLRLMEDILTEVAEIFPAEHFHAGLDEVNIEGCRRCARRSSGKPAWWIYAEHVKAIHGILQDCGKRMVMWADHAEAAPAMLDELPQDIVMAHWQYWGVDEEKIVRSLDKGFEVICAPAMCWHGTMIQPRVANFDCMDKMARTAAKHRKRGVLGMVNTWWVPWRHYRDAALFAVAYTAEIEAAGRAVDRIEAADRFARGFFGIRNKSIARALWETHELVPNVHECNALLPDSLTDVIDAIALARSDGFEQRAARAIECLSVLQSGREKVKRHEAEYEASVLAARTTALCLSNGLRMREASGHFRRAEEAHARGAKRSEVAGQLRQAAAAFGEISDELNDVFRAANADWKRTRYPRDEKKCVKDPETSGCPSDSLMGRLARCRAFHRGATRALRAAISTYRRGGPLPGRKA